MSNPRIFVVEDEAIIAADLCQRLVKMGYSVVGSADSGERAFVAAADARPDLILMDIFLKGPANGIETARRLREIHDVPVVYLTAHGDPRTMCSAIDTDPYGYVLKPFNDRELQIAIRVALHRHSTEARIRKTERWMATTLASIADGVISADREGRITLLNDAARRLTGWPGNEALGHPFDEVFRVIEGGDPREAETRGRGWIERLGRRLADRLLLRSRDGEPCVVDGCIAPILDEDGSPAGFVLVFRDCTEKQRLEQMHRDKLAADVASREKTRFLSRVSHELRNPLNAILGFTQLLQLDEAGPLDATQRSRVDKVRYAGEHLLELINDLLDLSRIEQGAWPMKLVPVRLTGVLETACAMVEAQARAREVALVVSPPDEPVSAMADGRALEQALVNLLSNGIKYNRRGGCLEVGVRATPRHVDVTIQDQGQGLDEHQVGNLFQAFNRLGAERSGIEGTGLGLVIVKGLVNAMNGELTVTSTPGQGTRFAMRLRRAETGADLARPCPGPGSVQRATAAKLPSATLLYLEDEPLNALLVTEALRTVPQWRMVTAQDGEEGLALAHRFKPDLVLIDINLPRMSGVQVVEALRADPSTRSLRCVALSADALPEQIKAALVAGFDDYWTKPLELASLVERLSSLMARLPG